MFYITSEIEQKMLNKWTKDKETCEMKIKMRSLQQQQGMTISQTEEKNKKD